MDIVRSMTRPKDRDAGGNADIEDLARRFHDLWRDQLAAMAADPEFSEIMRRWFGAVGGGAHAFGAPAAKGGAGAPAGVFGPLDPLNPMAWFSAFGAVPPGAAPEGKNRSDESDAAEHGGASATGAKAVAASPRAGDVAGDEFERRLADLERRLERLEAAIGRQGAGPSKGSRKRRT